MHRPRISADAQAGFTLVEFAAVIAIIGVLLTVIVPRAQRARVEAKYQVLRQNCTELASWANEWSTRELESQAIGDTSNLNDYMETLGGNSNIAGTLGWVGVNANSNWNTNGGLNPTDRLAVINRTAPPSATVSDLAPRESTLKNPFNGTPVFNPENDPGDVGAVVAGAIACTWQIDPSISPNHRYYALIFLGIDSENVNVFHAGQGTALTGLRNGVFVAALDWR